jgi:MFS family permease
MPGGFVADGEQPPTRAEVAELRRRSILGLNGLNFFYADMMTGFGPFVTVYLAANGWQPTDIGFALSVGTMAAVAGQLPAGMLVDAVHHRRLITGIGVAMVVVSALMLATLPSYVPVLGAQLLQGIANSLITPAVAAITLALSPSKRLGQRLGGNVRWKALGSMVTALFMGFVGTHLGTGAVFYVSALFGGIALGFLSMISGADILAAPQRTTHATTVPKAQRKGPMRRKRELWRDPLLLTFSGCVFMFHLSNAAVLPFATAAMKSQGIRNTDLLAAIALVVSQLVVALAAPRIGLLAQSRGRKLILLAGFVALALRCLALAIENEPYALVACQLLDGISGSVIGVMVPLVVSDITHEGGRFNFAMGFVGLAMAIGATLSTTIAGYLTEFFGTSVAFLCLAAAAAAGCVLVAFALPETGGDAPPNRPRGAAEASI